MARPGTNFAHIEKMKYRRIMWARIGGRCPIGRVSKYDVTDVVDGWWILNLHSSFKMEGN